MKTINDTQSLFSSRAQKTFIVLGIGAYLLQIAQLIIIAASVYRHGVRLSQFTLFIGETLFLPLIIFCLAFVMMRGLSRVERLCKAMVVSTVGWALWTLLILIFNRYFQIYLPYGNANWYSPFQELIPSVVAIGIVSIALLTRCVQPTALRVTASVVVLLVYGREVILMLKDDMHYYSMAYVHSALPTGVYYMIASACLLAVGVVNYLVVTNKRQTALARFYTSVFYLMIAGFLFTISGIVYVLLSRWQVVRSTSADSWLIAPAVGLLLYAGIIIWHKHYRAHESLLQTR